MKLHLGCGKRFIPGFTHIDAVEFPHVDVVSSVDRLPMVADNTCDVVYSCHVLEHFHRKIIVDVLKEWLRVLKPGGILRISVPDMQSLLEVYQETGNLLLILGPIFGRCDYLYNFHYTGFDFQTLKQILELAGAKNIRKYDWRQTEHASIDDYSQAYIPQDKEKGKLISLNVEANKA
ncbi:MAG: methyltransferase domain-containing protein [Nitrosarchaeum sp.]|nr:methyltransferase domain-containing protein [Nitrosarchaeum sp.]